MLDAVVIGMTTDPLDYRDSEVVFGVVAPVGVDLRQFSAVLRDQLDKFRYSVNEVRLSEFLRRPHVRSRHGVRLARAGEHQRINSLMTAGNRVREISGREDILALYAASEIAQKRPPGDFTPTAHILLSLKRSEEVATLRHIYGPGFFSIGVYATEAARLKYLTEDRAVPHDAARRLLTRDQDELDPHGQRTSRTFQLADVFVHLDERHLDEFKKSVQRFVDLVFGAPFQTPTRDEHAMFLAFAASLRSADLARQVGAVVVSATGDIIATGANDVPAFGVAARRYFDLFSMRISSGWPLERKVGAKAIDFKRSEAKPRVPMAPTSFSELELIATQIIRDRMR